jgi:rubrerythrin
MTGPSATQETDVAKVRLVLVRELETINVYEALAREATSPAVKAFMEHLAAEEKEHVAEATWLLRQLDPGQAADFAKPFSTAHFLGTQRPAEQAAAAAPSPAPAQPTRFYPENFKVPHEPRRAVYALPAPPSELSGGFTVGPLKRRR